MLFHQLHPETPSLAEVTAQRVVVFGEKRLKEYNVEASVPHGKPSLLTKSVSPSFEIGVIDSIQLHVGHLLGQGIFSSAYEIISLNGTDDDGVGSMINSPSVGDSGQEPSELSPFSTTRLVIKVLKPKLIKRPSLFAGCAADLVREGLLLSRLSHKNMLRCHGTIGMGGMRVW